MGLACAQAQEVTIGSKADWDAFAARVNAGETSLNAIMTADVLEGVTTMVGTQSNPYGGTFNGNGHTLTLELTCNENQTAPFSRVSGATIENLKTTGSVVRYNGSSCYNSGLVGCGAVTVRNCWVAADIVNTNASAGLFGGCDFDQYKYDSYTIIENCLFSGSNNAPNLNGVGLVNGCNHPTITNCLNAGTFKGDEPIVYISPYNVGTVTNCYYTMSTDVPGTYGIFTEKRGHDLAELLGPAWGVSPNNEVVPVIFLPVEVSVPDMLLCLNETATVGIGITNNHANLVSFQMDVYLPEGISVNRSGCSLTSRFSSGELTIGRQNDGSYRVTATAFTLNPITGTEGDLVNLSLTASASAAEGEATIRNIRFVNSGSATVLAEDVTFTIKHTIEQSITLTELPAMTYGDGVYTLPEETDQGMPIDWSVDNSAVAKVVGNNLMIVGAGTATVTAYQEGNDRYMELEKSYQLTVNKAPLTVTANSYTIEQGEALPAFAATYEGFVYNQTQLVLTAQPTFTCEAANSDVPGTYTITPAGAEAKNYEMTYVSGTLTITPQSAVTVTANSYTIQYGDPLPEFGYTAEGTLLGGAPTLSCEASSSSPVGTYPITVTKGSLENYNITLVGGTLTIVKAPLTITAQDAEMTYGGEVPEFIPIFEGFKNGETEAILKRQPVLAAMADEFSIPGEYEIMIGSAKADNYEISYVNGTLTIGKAPLTVIPQDATMTYGDELPTFEVSYEGFRNNDDVSTLTMLPVLATTATPASSVGMYEITASGAASELYDMSYATGTLTVEKAQLTITVQDAVMEYGDELPDFNMAVAGFRNGDDDSVLTTSPTFTTVASPSTGVGSYNIEANGAEADNYDFTYVAGTLTIEKAPLTITAQSYIITQGDPIPEFESLYDGFKNGEDESVLKRKPQLASFADEFSEPGDYEIIVAGARADNYEISYVNGTLTIMAPEPSMPTFIARIPNSGVQLSSRNGEVSVCGLADGTQVNVYTAEGMLVGTTKVVDGKATITTSLAPGTVAIVRMGKKSVKMVVK